MALTTIEYGSLASSQVMNDNFEYLDDKIAQLSESMTSNNAGIYSSMASMNTTLSEATEAVSTSVSDLRTYTENLKDQFETFCANNGAPDYANAVGISLPYTVTQNGYVYAGVDGIDSYRYVKVNGKVVHGHCGYSGGKAVYSGSLFRVSPGDRITCDKTLKSYYFYPMKGAE